MATPKARMRPLICPVCGERVTLTGQRARNGRVIASCGDAFFQTPRDAVLNRLRHELEQEFVGIAPDLAAADDDNGEGARMIAPADLRDYMFGSFAPHDQKVRDLWRGMKPRERSAFLKTVWPDGDPVYLR